LTFDRFLQEACPGLDLRWRKYRRRSARHRVDRRIAELGVDGYGDYLHLIRNNAEEAALLPDLMLVTVTRFFREAKAWQQLKDRVLPGLMADRGAERRLLAWSAGCCGGEEPLSLALLWLHYFLPEHPGWSLQVVATDIDQASLTRASHGLYRWEELREVPQELRSRWFSQNRGFWQVDGRASDLVVFQNRNLMTDPPPAGMDLVLCRYLAFTYYQGSRLQNALRRVWEALRPGGVLMIGAQEELPPPALELFAPHPAGRFFYRRLG